MSRPTSCEVCGTALCEAGDATTGLCGICRHEGARFADRWLRDLLAGGEERRVASRITGISSNTIGRRLRRAQREPMGRPAA